MAGFSDEQLADLNKALNQRDAHRRRQTMSGSAIGGGLVVLIGALFAWALTTTHDNMVKTAEQAAESAARNYLKESPQVQEFSTRTQQALSEVINAQTAAGRAQREAATAESLIDALNARLAKEQKIIEFEQDFDKLTVAVATRPELQKAVAAAITQHPLLTVTAKLMQIDEAKCLGDIHSKRCNLPGVPGKGTFVGASIGQTSEESGGHAETIKTLDTYNADTGGVLFISRPWGNLTGMKWNFYLLVFRELDVG